MRISGIYLKVSEKYESEHYVELYTLGRWNSVVNIWHISISKRVKTGLLTSHPFDLNVVSIT